MRWWETVLIVIGVVAVWTLRTYPLGKMIEDKIRGEPDDPDEPNK